MILEIYHWPMWKDMCLRNWKFGAFGKKIIWMIEFILGIYPPPPSKKKKEKEKEKEFIEGTAPKNQGVSFKSLSLDFEMGFESS